MNANVTQALTNYEAGRIIDFVYDEAQCAARRTYVAKTDAAHAVKEYASSLYIAAVDTKDDGEAVRAVARAFAKTYDEVCDAAYAELQAAYAAASAAMFAAYAAL